MDSRTVLVDFSNINNKTETAAKFIISQDPFRFEEKYGNSLINFSDRELFDIFIHEMKFYRMFYIAKVISYYSMFYDYCVENGLIIRNPFDKSIYFTYSYMISAVVASGNVELYSKEYIIKRCTQMGYNSPYYLSVVLSIFEGVRDLITLAQIKYSDVDFHDKTLKVGNIKMKISEELISAYKNMYKMEHFESLKINKKFYDDNGLLIRQIPPNGKTVVEENPKLFSLALGRKIRELELNATFLYDSGLIFRLMDIIGKDEFINMMDLGNSSDKKYMININKQLKEIFDDLGVSTSVKNFMFDYRIYGLCIKHNILK